VGIEYEAFLPALSRLGHEVRHFETWDRNRHPTYSELNHALLAETEKYRPEMVFTVQRDYEIWTETLAAIQRRGEAALATWTTDDSFKFHMVSKYIGPYYDAISTTYDYRVLDYKAAGIEGVYFTQWAANSHWLKPPLPARSCRYPVSFIGARYGARAAVVEKLKSVGIHVECFGFGWPNGSVATERIPEIMRDSAISLNFSAGFMSDAGNDRQIKARTFEVPGAGGFLLTDAAPGLDGVYEIGKEIEVYDGMAELEREIRYYLEHPEERDAIANAGHLRTANCHTYERRLEGLVQLAVERRGLRAGGKSAGAGVETSGAMETLPAGRLGAALGALRWFLVKACGMVWGAERGPKAARRLVFAASRRIFGAGTFSARSLPGRMFPYV
jgi:spore maturation protein CgeB